MNYVNDNDDNHNKDISDNDDIENVDDDNS